MLMNLCVSLVPRRSSHYANMVVIRDYSDLRNKKNDTDILLFVIYTKELKRFVFNYWRCSNKKGSQAFNIIDAKIQNALSLYLDDDQYRDPDLETYTTPNGKRYKYLLYHRTHGFVHRSSHDTQT